MEGNDQKVLTSLSFNEQMKANSVSTQTDFIPELLESPEIFISNSRRLQNGFIYEGFYRHGQKFGRGKIRDDNCEQFVEGEWVNDHLVKLYLAQFRINSTDNIRLYPMDNLYTSDKNNFVARINSTSVDISSENLIEIRKQIESKIVISNILDDDLKNNLDISRKKFEMILNIRQNHIAHSKEAQYDIFQLLLIMKTIPDEEENITFLTKITNNLLYTERLRNAAKNVCQDEKNISDRNKGLLLMPGVADKFSWVEVISKCVKNSVINLKIAYKNVLPSKTFIFSGQEDLNKISERQLFKCSVQDFQLFSDLELTSEQYLKDKFNASKFKEFIQNYVNKLWTLFIDEIIGAELNSTSTKETYTNSVFLQLFKTLLEMITPIFNECKEEVSKVFSVEPNGDLRVIQENIEESKIGRLKFLIILMNYFKPGKIQSNRFKYNFTFFNVDDGLIKKLTGFIASYFDNSAINEIPQEYAIWLYQIHQSFHEIFKGKEDHYKFNKQTLFVILNSLMNLCLIAIKSKEVSLETVRILSNSIIKFAITVSPYFSQQTSLSEFEINILLKQAEYMKNYVTCNVNSADDITNIVDIYQVFWEERKILVTDLTSKYSTWSSAIDKIIEKFNSFTKYVFNLNIYNDKFLLFLRSYNEFMRLLRGTYFPWYIKHEDLISERFVGLINEDTNSYIVQDTNEFIKEFLEESKNLPCQYFFNLSEDLLSCAEDFVQLNSWLETDKLQAAGDLLLLMGRSLINFNRLPGAVDFQHFLSLFTGPFKRVTQRAIDLCDFKRRLASLKNYYKYTMELNVMSIDKALKLCEQNTVSESSIDYTFNSTSLKLAYATYDKKLKNYIEKYIMQPDFHVEEFAEKIKTKIQKCEISKWDQQYKILEVPRLVAGLSAVWSALESKDVICQNQIIKPHCIQILCVLRLLGADQIDVGIRSHLAQVLTGQGKSLILALLATALALTGNRARIVCYNKCLAERDAHNFCIFYKIFNMEDDIIYGTFNDMANEILNSVYEKKNYNLRTLVEQLLTDELPNMYERKIDHFVPDTVLLIDEVDVFFSKNFYGTTYNPICTVESETFAKLQILIWNLTVENNTVIEIREKVQKYIDEQYFQNADDIFKKIVRNSRNILNIEVDHMISNAISTRRYKNIDLRKFKLLDDGLIIFIGNDGEHKISTYCNYFNVFIYFKLKKSNFDHENFHNYGYLIIDCGNISYALLPKNYNSILGVTGTLKQLSNVEIRAVQSYGILFGSDMPTFFGSNKLQITNFSIKDTEESWINAILSSISSIVNSERAVIVFFEDEHIIEKMRDKFSKHLSRYSVLTGNEDSEEVSKCVEESGIARRITIATRFMGRGTDFKSSDSSVETKGGVHVIQTFFSEDVKEETQIKGRTCRKDNKGSYEMILCREHLNFQEYDCSKSTYDQLNSDRELRAEEQGYILMKQIEESNKNHHTTMKFLQSFLNYSRDKRDMYLEEVCNFNKQK